MFDFSGKKNLEHPGVGPAVCNLRVEFPEQEKGEEEVGTIHYLE